MSHPSVLITGASKGIGRATALLLAERGFHVFAGVRRESDGAELQAEAAGLLTPIQIDITDQTQIDAAGQQVASLVGEAGLNGLVNNAGIAVPGPLELIPIDQLRWQLEVNVVGQIAVTQQFLPLIRQATGRIVNISSMGGRIAGSMVGAYNASKFALEAMCDTLRLELKPWGIDVICIEPGAIATPIWETSGNQAKQMLDGVPADKLALYRQRVERGLSQLEGADAQGISPYIVANVIHKALTVPRPRTRYLVGMDANIVGRFIAPLPDRIRDWILSSRR